jgi:hypothetical protein
MGTAVRPARTSPGSWDAFAGVDLTLVWVVAPAGYLSTALTPFGGTQPMQRQHNQAEPVLRSVADTIASVASLPHEGIIISQGEVWRSGQGTGSSMRS